MFGPPRAQKRPRVQAHNTKPPTGDLVGGTPCFFLLCPPSFFRLAHAPARCLLLQSGFLRSENHEAGPGAAVATMRSPRLSALACDLQVVACVQSQILFRNMYPGRFTSKNYFWVIYWAGCANEIFVRVIGTWDLVSERNLCWDHKSGIENYY